MTLKTGRFNTAALALTGCLASYGAHADDHAHSAQTHYPHGSQSSFEGPDNLFTGNVSVDILFPENENTNFSGAYVTFEPGARTAWHSHPAGQHMVVTSGTALTGTRDGKVIKFTEGETVWCPPGEDHWHGATPHASMTHLVVTGSKDGENVVWKEKVTDAQYAAGNTDTGPTFKALNAQQQAIVPIAAFAASGDMASLKVAMADGLDAGLTVNEIREIHVHLYGYTGFPRALNAMANLMTLVEERKANGINDPVGPQPSSIPEGESSLVIGEQVQTELVGRPVSGPLFDFAPVMNTYLQSHLFGDIFARGIFDYEHRELITVAALASLDGAEPQLAAHIRMATNVGVTEAQLHDIAASLAHTIGRKQGQRVEQAIENVLHAEG